MIKYSKELFLQKISNILSRKKKKNREIMNAIHILLS